MSELVYIESRPTDRKSNENYHRFSKEEWLTQNQIKRYFSWLAFAKRKGQKMDVDDRAELEDIVGEQAKNSRQLLINSIIEKIGLSHQIFTMFTTFTSTARAANG